MFTSEFLCCRYNVAYIICPTRTHHTPELVSLYAHDPQNITIASATNILNITIITERSSRERQFTVCISPLHGEPSPSQFVESTELNRMFHAEYFIIYNTLNSTASIQPYLEYYSRLGLASVLPWTLPWRTPTILSKSVHYYAQMAAVNDCVFRNKYVSKYVVLTDIDEIIVPMKSRNWHELLDDTPNANISINGTLTDSTNKSTNVTDLSVHPKRPVGSYSFRCVFFTTRSASDPRYVDHPLVKKYNVLSLLKTTRKKLSYPHRIRSKTIIIPERVSVAGNHLVHRWQDPHTRPVYVPDSKGLLFHYRQTCPLQIRNSTDVPERRMHYFAGDAVRRLKRVYSSVNGSS